MTHKTVALVAHDHKKPELIQWSKTNIHKLRQYKLVATGTTGGLLQEALGLPITRYRSGPLGGDQQIGALIAEGKLDVLVFFWDPLDPAPHDPDVKALLRLCSVWNIPVACNKASADLMFNVVDIDAPDYQRDIPDYGK
ncbi:methylglyoxal synthase [Bowmanella sp. JS7-9]|uniref:Methylglyoxal synthase n=1 Tax=Pseudobowmanella zhangzhouensis TaxID=1537679 RepID=A0ABW1XIB9_9ALTE|nr:methylglyoxal synthase [Bowmanella sp. JS7-9]TBX21275.1 methylglyoxal synthase [Bowmanella sp. JS7-9]